MVNKLSTVVYEKYANELFSDNPSYTQDVTIYVKLPDTEREDNQLFVKIEPLSFHSLQPIENAYECTVPGSSIFRRYENTVGILDLIKYI